MREKIHIAISGLLDSGKSTFIKNIAEYFTGREVKPDALLEEQDGEKTITNTRVTFPMEHNGTMYDVVLIDCPGHFEYFPEIMSGYMAADMVVFARDMSSVERMMQSDRYAFKLSCYAKALGKVIGLRIVTKMDQHYNNVIDDLELRIKKGICIHAEEYRYNNYSIGLPFTADDKYTNTREKCFNDFIKYIKAFLDRKYMLFKHDSEDHDPLRNTGDIRYEEETETRWFAQYGLFPYNGKTFYCDMSGNKQMNVQASLCIQDFPTNRILASCSLTILNYDCDDEDKANIHSEMNSVGKPGSDLLHTGCLRIGDSPDIHIIDKRREIMKHVDMKEFLLTGDTYQFIIKYSYDGMSPSKVVGVGRFFDSAAYRYSCEKINKNALRSIQSNAS